MNLLLCINHTGMIYFLWPANAEKYFRVAAPRVSDEYDSLINETM